MKEEINNLFQLYVTGKMKDSRYLFLLLVKAEIERINENIEQLEKKISA